MKILKYIVICLLVLVAALAAIGLLLPSEYKVERSTSVVAPIDIVFDQVNDLKKNEAWSPWDDQDPTMKITYSEVTAGKGASSSWTSMDMGSGKQTIEESVPNSAIATHLDFGKMGQAKAHWTFVQEGEAVKVTQTMTGDQGANPFKRWFGLMMDKMIGQHFEKGLADLKKVSETQAAARKSEVAATQQAAAAPADSSVPAAAAPAAAPSAATTPVAPKAR